MRGGRIKMHLLYCEVIKILPQVVEELDSQNLPQPVEKLCSIPWGYHIVSENFLLLQT